MHANAFGSARARRTNTSIPPLSLRRSRIARSSSLQVQAAATGPLGPAIQARAAKVAVSAGFGVEIFKKFNLLGSTASLPPVIQAFYTASQAINAAILSGVDALFHAFAFALNALHGAMADPWEPLEACEFPSKSLNP